MVKNQKTQIFPQEVTRRLSNTRENQDVEDYQMILDIRGTRYTGLHWLTSRDGRGRFSGGRQKIVLGRGLGQS